MEKFLFKKIEKYILENFFSVLIIWWSKKHSINNLPYFLKLLIMRKNYNGLMFFYLTRYIYVLQEITAKYETKFTCDQQTSTTHEYNFEIWLQIQTVIAYSLLDFYPLILILGNLFAIFNHSLFCDNHEDCHVSKRKLTSQRIVSISKRQRVFLPH